MSKPLDLTKPYRTSEGGEAQAIPGPDGKLYGWHRDINDDHPTMSGRWHADGKFDGYSHNEVSPWDLVNVPETRTVNVWLARRYDPHDNGDYWTAYNSREHMEKENVMCSGRCIASIEREITYTVGEGLEP